MANDHIYGSPDIITQLIFDKFIELPKKGKPTIRPNGVKEWTVLAGIVIETPTTKPKCVSLATGVKAIPNDKLSLCNGTVLHDMHAEILSIRGFNRFILEECIKAVNTKSNYIIYKKDDHSNYKFFAYPDIKISLFVSEPPCGDSSMSVISNGQENGWTNPLEMITEESGVARGRDHFLQVGITRTKPGRRDSPITYSKSCSDKLCLKQITSLLTGPLTSIICPKGFYLSDIIIPTSVFNEDDFIRAFNGRLVERSKRKRSDDSILPPSLPLPEGYKPKLFHYRPVTKEWQFKKPQDDNSTSKPTPTSILYIEGLPFEAISNGVKMGAKPFLGKGQSCICRKQLCETILNLYKQIEYKLPDNSTTYIPWKKQNHQRYLLKQSIYTILKGWVNTKDDDFPLYT